MVRLAGLKKSYGEKTILDIPLFTFEEGRMYTIVGTNGAGKTTLLRIINKLEAPSSGSVDSCPARRDMVLCFQKPYMFKATVRENVEYGLKVRSDPAFREKAEKAMKELGIESLAERNAQNLSSGEVKKVSLARAFALEPALLLLDEPLANLDPESRDLVIEKVSEIRESGATVIMSTHILEEYVHLTQNVLRLENGNIQSGEPLNIFEGTVTDCGDGPVFNVPEGPGFVVATSKRGPARAVLSPREIILSPDELKSSMRNVFKGTISSIGETNGMICITMDIGIELKTFITPDSLEKLHLESGSHAFVSFKAVSVKIY